MMARTPFQPAIDILDRSSIWDGYSLRRTKSAAEIEHAAGRSDGFGSGPQAKNFRDGDHGHGIAVRFAFLRSPTFAQRLLGSWRLRRSAGPVPREVPCRSTARVLGAHAGGQRLKAQAD